MTDPRATAASGHQDPRVEEKWAQYPCTVLELRVPDRPRIDLRKALGDRDRAMLRDLGLDRPFAVLTAENPWGENAEDEPSAAREDAAERRNASRREELERELRSAGTRFVHCDGVAPDGDYREHGVAALLEREAAISIARRYRQLAIFWYDGRDFWLVGAVAEKPSLRLPA